MGLSKIDCVATDGAKGTPGSTQQPYLESDDTSNDKNAASTDGNMDFLHPASDTTASAAPEDVDNRRGQSDMISAATPDTLPVSIVSELSNVLVSLSGIRTADCAAADAASAAAVASVALVAYLARKKLGLCCKTCVVFSGA